MVTIVTAILPRLHRPLFHQLKDASSKEGAVYYSDRGLGRKSLGRYIEAYPALS